MAALTSSAFVAKIPLRTRASRYASTSSEIAVLISVIRHSSAATYPARSESGLTVFMGSAAEPSARNGLGRRPTHLGYPGPEESLGGTPPARSDYGTVGVMSCGAHVKLEAMTTYVPAPGPIAKSVPAHIAPVQYHLTAAWVTGSQRSTSVILLGPRAFATSLARA